MSDDSARKPAKDETSSTGKKKSPLLKALKIFLITVGVLVALLLGIITVAVSYLSPRRLTPLVEKLANDNLHADVTLGRAEISFWKTFPRLVVEIDSLNVRSQAFDSLPEARRASLPVYSDSLLSLRSFSGALSIPALLKGDIALDYITLDSPKFNLVQATPELSSIDIFPTSAEGKSKSSSSMPDISIGRFGIKGGFPIRYTSVPDSIDASVVLSTTSLDGEQNPRYVIEVNGLTSASVADFTLSDISLGLDGEVKWSPAHPYLVELDRFSIGINDIRSLLSAKVDFDNTPTVESLNFQLLPAQASSLINLIPSDIRGELAKVDARFTIAAALELTSPFRLGTDTVPSAFVSLDIPEGSADYDGMHLDKFSLRATAAVDGAAPDKSVITVERLHAVGEGIGFDLKATVTSPLSDPRAVGKFKGGLRAQRLPKSLFDNLPLTARGDLKADFDFDLRRSYLTRENFHHIKLSGDATLTGLEVAMAAMGVDLKARELALKLGTSSSFVTGAGTIDSLITASLTVDTISCQLPGMSLQGARIKAGVGMKNIAATADTTQITPLGGRLVADRIVFSTTAEDSMRLRLRNAIIGASVRRFKADTSKPQLTLNVTTDRAFYGSDMVKAIVGKAMLYVTVHPQMPRVRPAAPTDSASIARRAERREARRLADSIARAQDQVLDIGVDGSLANIMRKWNARGTLRADRVGVFTPAFPLRTRLSALRLDFTSDSLNLREIGLRLGRSNFTVNGTVANITRALTSRSGRQPLRARLTLDADTIDVNQLTAAIFAGAAWTESHTSMGLGADTENEATLEAASHVSSDSMAVFVVPSNIDAALSVTAHHISYSNLIFKNFAGKVDVFDGAVKLSDLRAASDIGSIALTALYSAPVRTDASFAFGMNVSDFNLAQFMRIVPAVDSIMPLLNGISGIINAQMAATTRIDSAMNIELPTLKAALSIKGDSLRLIDEEVYRKIGKWLLFKDRQHNVIDSMSVQMVIEDSRLELFPFIFNLDRYRLGVMGSNDLALNLNYHIAVLKSPIPFKFGINVKGTPDKMKIRLGRAHFNEKSTAATYQLADTTRINLVREISNIFRRGVSGAKLNPLSLKRPAALEDVSSQTDTLSSADSLYFKQQGLQF